MLTFDGERESSEDQQRKERDEENPPCDEFSRRSLWHAVTLPEPLGPRRTLRKDRAFAYDDELA